MRGPLAGVRVTGVVQLGHRDGFALCLDPGDMNCVSRTRRCSIDIKPREIWLSSKKVHWNNDYSGVPEASSLCCCRSDA